MFHEADFFLDISGLEDAKLAILLLLTSPDLKSLLLSGVCGTGKSALARMAGMYTRDHVVHLPPRATLDRVFGSIDIGRSITEGRRIFQPGLLKEADNGVLLIDDIHLMDPDLAVSICTAAQTGLVILERDGFSSEYTSDFRIIATVNPIEGELSPALLDRFDLCSACHGIDDSEMRKHLIRTAMQTGRSRLSDADSMLRDHERHARHVEGAKQRCRYVRIPDGLMDLITDVGKELNIEGHRGEIALASSSRTLAALHERDHVVLDDISRVAPLTLEHRRKDACAHPPPMSDQELKSEDRSSGADQSHDNENEMSGDEEMSSEGTGSPREHQGDNPQPDQVFSVGDPARIQDLLSEKSHRYISFAARSGKKTTTMVRGSRGRYVRAGMPRGFISDIALDATIREAAPYQKLREKNGMALSLSVQDIRVKERRRKTGRTIIFLVDSSGSMGVQKRMTAVKGAVLSLLKEAYIRRDQVSLISFRGTRSEILLRPTRSGMLAYNHLANLPTGGLTPLSDGINKAVTLIRTIRRRNIHDEPLVIILSDGRANYSLSGSDPAQEADGVALSAQAEKAQFIVIDTECGYPRLCMAKNLAKKIGGTYVRLDDMTGEKIASLVKSFRGWIQ